MNEKENILYILYQPRTSQNSKIDQFFIIKWFRLYYI